MEGERLAPAADEGAAIGAAHVAAGRSILSDEVWHVEEVLPPGSAVEAVAAPVVMVALIERHRASARLRAVSPTTSAARPRCALRSFQPYCGSYVRWLPAVGRRRLVRRG